MSNQISILAPAKINLTLDVLGKRSDGYHELATVMHQVDLCDRIHIQRIEAGIVLDSDSREMPLDRENLAVQAAALLLERFRSGGGVHIFIEKKIPVGAGLAGGSTDAAAVLTALNQLLDLGCSLEELQLMGAELGSDIPFCLAGGTALCTGRGEIVQPLAPGPRLHFLLVKPPYSLSTARVYQNYRPERVFSRPRLEPFISAWQRCDMMEVARQMGNVLESVSIEMKPEIQAIKDQALALGAIAAIMSGSGPTVAALFPGAEEAREAAVRMGKQYCQCYAVCSLTGESLVERQS